MTRRRTLWKMSMTLAVCAASFVIAPALRAAETATTDVSTARGAEVFSTYCVLCHGPAGRGDGRAAALQPVPPADLTASRRSAAYRLQIISGGGAALQRSSSMPAWRDVLTARQISDVAEYLRTLAAPTARAAVVSASRANAATPRRETPQ